jgi:hypothetical protein
MDSQVAWILCPILFGIVFIIETCFFLYKLINRRNVDDRGTTTISISSGEVSWCMGCIWKYALDRTTNQMKLSIFIIWYIVSISLSLLVTVGMFLGIYYQGFS